MFILTSEAAFLAYFVFLLCHDQNNPLQNPHHNFGNLENEDIWNWLYDRRHYDQCATVFLLFLYNFTWLKRYVGARLTAADGFKVLIFWNLNSIWFKLNVLTCTNEPTLYFVKIKQKKKMVVALLTKKLSKTTSSKVINVRSSESKLLSLFFSPKKAEIRVMVIKRFLKALWFSFLKKPFLPYHFVHSCILEKKSVHVLLFFYSICFLRKTC